MSSWTILVPVAQPEQWLAEDYRVPGNFPDLVFQPYLTIQALFTKDRHVSRGRGAASVRRNEKHPAGCISGIVGGTLAKTPGGKPMTNYGAFLRRCKALGKPCVEHTGARNILRDGIWEEDDFL